MDNETSSGEQQTPAPTPPGTRPDQAGNPPHFTPPPGRPFGATFDYSTPTGPGRPTPPGPAAPTTQPTGWPQPSAGAAGVPSATVPRSTVPAALATRRRGGGLRTLVAAVMVSALVGAGTGIAGYSALDHGTTPASVQVAGGTAPVAAVLDGTVSAAAKAISPSTVTIEVRSSQSGGLGTGIVLDTQGHVLTNQHVVEGAGQGGSIRVTLDDGRTAAARVVGESSTTDLAVIQLEDGDVDVSALTPATFASSSSVGVGQSVVAVGAPLGLSKTVTSGVVSNTARPVRSGLSNEAVYQAVQTDAAINPGNSGGPLVDLDGRVVGINSSIASTADSASGEQAGSIGIGFAIPADVASRVANDIIATGSAPDPSLGVTLSGNDGRSSATTAQDVTGVAVQTVQPGSAAEQAGLRSGDVITAIGDSPTPSADAVIAAVRFWAPGTEVTVAYSRDGQPATAQVTLGTA